ncbi:MAG TPA: AAA family ATPase [Kofleriaceae bacterium]|nr:AAA family ATPase [Kofleriaceae bacterium]
MISGTGSTRPLRGRKREVAMIATALARAAEGHPSTVVLVGEPGIGKSRLAMEAAATATTAGWSTRWGRAWEAGGAPPYWPWRQICDQADRTGSMAQLWSSRGGAATDPDQARFELFDAVTRSLATACEATPTLCILDDLHAADVPSLELLAFATRHMRGSRLVWLLTWRDAEGGRAPVRDALARIAREATIMPLAALTDVDANELIDDVHRGADIELRDKLLRATGGNPLFLLETLSALATGHVMASDLEQLPIAHGIAVIVQDRLGPLDGDIHKLAAAASAVGREVSLERWVAAASATPDLVRRGAQALVGAGILTVLGRDRWRFGHDLVREAIYRAAGDDVIEVHRRLARVLDAAVAAGDVSMVGERAHHGLLSFDDPGAAIEWTIAAADHARSQCAYEEALAIIERALSTIGTSAQQHAALQLARGRALLDLGEARKASEAFATVTELARRANDPRMVAEAALGLGARYVLGDNPHDLIVLLDQAMAALPEDERELQARLLARKAAALTPAPDPEPVIAMALDAYQRVADSPDESVRLEVAVAVGSALTGIAHARASIPVDETVVSLARKRGDRALELRGLSRLVTDYMQANELARADAILANRDALARSLVQPRFAWTEPLFRSMRAMLRGDFAVCDAAISEAETFRIHDPNAARACAVHRTWLLLAADRVDDLRAHEPVVLDAIRTMEPILASVIRAAIRYRTGDMAGARGEVDALDPSLAHGRAPIILATLAEVVAAVGPESMQREIYELLAPHADGNIIFGLFAIVCGPPVAATLGQLAAAFGDHERARAHFESARTMATSAGAHASRAWTSYWFGRALAAAGDPDAARVIDDAIREASQLGMTRLVERCRALVTTPAAGPPAEPAVTRGPLAAVDWTLREQAGSWIVTHAGKSFLVPNLRGMPMLARLAATPHVEIHSLELVSGAAEPDLDTGDAGELLDDKARAAYRKRVAQLADAIEDAEARGDVARAEAARDEHETLLKELSRAVGLGGKVRRAGAAAERARVASHRRLREAIKKIEELDGELGAHLAKAVRTGMFCAYRP